MARLLYWSDLHTEFNTFTLPKPDDVGPIDAVLLGGDTAVGDAHLDTLFAVWETYGVPVLSIRGNHEYYKQVWEDMEERDAARLKVWHDTAIPIYVLDGDSIVIKDVRIIGATLWTDMRVMGDEGIFAIPKVERALNDYHQIRVRSGSMTRHITAKDTITKHVSDREAIFHHLAQPFEGKTLVMTHHIPTPLCIHPQYKDDVVTAGFASDLTDRIAETCVDVWTYGHTHKKTDDSITRDDGGTTRFVSNIRGYPHEYDPEQFSPTFVIEL